MKPLSFFSLVAACWFSLTAYSDVVINELYYNPPDDNLVDGGFREFIELYNPTDARIDLSGYLFDTGITFTFPSGTWIEAHSYVVVARDKSTNYWRNVSFRMVGPYEGFLADGGERLTLKRSDGTTVENFKYNDKPLWPIGADGYGMSLERISWDLPADDPHSWRSSLTSGGTPGVKNSVDGLPPYPLIQSHAFNPPHPTSSDDVQVQVTFDAPSQIKSVTLGFEGFEGNSASNENFLAASDSQWQYWKGKSAPSANLEWTTMGFNDSTWMYGSGGFGYGDLDQVNSVLSDMRNNYSTLYIRKKFSVKESQLTGEYLLQIYYDDGFVCYVNGVEVARSNAPDSYTYSSVATANYESDSVDTFTLNLKGILQAGENVISLIGFNVSLGNSSDFVLSPSLVLNQNAGEPQNCRVMTIVKTESDSVTYQAVVPRMASQTLVRANLHVELTNGQTVVLPPENEPAPFLSYFVFDGEFQSTLPILWLLPARKSTLLSLSKSVSGAVCLPVGATVPDVFDGAIQLPSASSRIKVKFIKGAEFYGDRTINIIPEIPTGGTNAGISSPYREHLGFWFYKEMNVLTQWSEFYRIVTLPVSSSKPHTQQLVNEQVNEQFLKKNGLNEDGDLYKLVYSYPNFEKHTNKAEGTGTIDDLLLEISTRDVAKRRSVMEERIDLEEFLAYSAASIFMSNWDGYWNNNWMYLNPDTLKWVIIPWDLDWCWGSTPPPNTGPMYWKMPLSFPIDGIAVGDTNVSRNPGPVTSPMHQEPQFYADYVSKLGYEFNRNFSHDKMVQKLDAMQELLLADLDLIQSQTGRSVDTRKQQIQESYTTLKLYMDRRREYLQALLPVPVRDWPLY